MREIVSFLVIIIFFCTCIGGGKKQGLPQEDPLEVLVVDMMGYDSLPFNPGIKLTDTRSIDKAEPPKVINYSGSISEADFDISKYYSKAKTVLLEHPQTEEGRNQFFTPYDRRLMFGGFGSYWVEIFTQVLITDKYILAGDPFYGLHCYDMDGNFLYTLTTSINPPPYKEEGGLEIHFDNIKNALADFKVIGNTCMFVTLTETKATVHFHDLDSRTTYYQRQMDVQKVFPLSSKEYANFNYELMASERKPFIYTFNTSRDTLSQFVNYNVLPKFSGDNYHNPGPSNIYYYNDVPTVRQVGNDTIYRIVSADRLKPAYVLNFGKEKADLQNLISGKNENKKVLWGILETDKFIYARYDEVGSDAETSQKRYSIYEKDSGRVFYIPNKDNKDNIQINNLLSDGFPFSANQMRSNGRQLYCFYTKAQFKHIVDSEGLGSLSDIQKERIKNAYKKMTEKELSVMILE